MSSRSWHQSPRTSDRQLRTGARAEAASPEAPARVGIGEAPSARTNRRPAFKSRRSAPKSRGSATRIRRSRPPPPRARPEAGDRPRRHLLSRGGRRQHPHPCSLAAGRRLVLGHGGPNESLQSPLVQLVAFVEVDGAPDVAFETGIEEA